MNAVLRRVLLLVLILPAAALAEPCTLYKAEDIANARQNVARYPWAQRIVEGWKRSVQVVMEKDRQFIVTRLLSVRYYARRE